MKLTSRRGEFVVHKKAATNVRVTEYELTRARSIANHMKMKLSDYFNMVLHDANERYHKRTLNTHA